MRSFTVLLKNELKLNIRNMNMVIFAVILPLVVLVILGFCTGQVLLQKGLALPFGAIYWCALYHFHLCWRFDGAASGGIGIPGKKNT